MKFSEDLNILLVWGNGTKEDCFDSFFMKADFPYGQHSEQNKIYQMVRNLPPQQQGGMLQQSRPEKQTVGYLKYNFKEKKKIGQ